ncbi:MAG: phosphoadenosine phosphosulfate reductase family protein [Prevotella sp.]|nr:phosphoadenosine phosphosulfate reductase family protein [Candidatus Prevotella equi]
MTKQESALDSINFIKEKTDEIIIMCSLGKDSLVVLDMVYPHFKRIVCVFMYFVKDLEHINRWVNWVKAKYPKVEFMQVPHWNLTYILRSGLYCTPNPKIKLLKLADVCVAMRKKTGIDYVFLGMKRADSMNRRLFLDTYKDNHYENNFMVYPLADWTQKDVLAYMKMHQLPEPVRYGKQASGGVGLNLEFFLWCEEHCPNDLEKIYKAFPMSRRILLEYHYKEGKNLH